MSLITDTNTQATCRGCGKCCRKGGPALHTKDAFLFEENFLTVRDLVTIRAGELVRDTAEDALVPLPAELVKIAPAAGVRPDDWTCRFLTSMNRCSIHGKHPAECRALFCEAPQALLMLAGEPRLERSAICDLVKAPAWWKELIQTHEEKVPYGRLTELAGKLDTDDDARREFISIVEYDRSFRQLVVEKGGAAEEELPFLFGRPLLQTIVMYGMDARDDGDAVRLVRTTRV